MWTGRHISPGRGRKIIAAYCDPSLTNGSTTQRSSLLISSSSENTRKTSELDSALRSTNIPQLLHVRRDLKSCLDFCELGSVIIKKIAVLIQKCTVQLESEFHKASLDCAMENLLRKMFKDSLRIIF